MINGLSRYSKNGVRKAFDYLLASASQGIDRDPPPALIVGNREIIEGICSSLSYRHKYTSGVLSFSKEETRYIDSVPNLKAKIIQEFEDFCFAGLCEDCRCYAAVEHRHTGRLEIHYVIPRVHLGAKKYFNPFPPGHRYANDAFIDYMACSYGITNPRSPGRLRTLRVSPYDTNKSTKLKIHEFIQGQIKEGRATCASEINSILTATGMEVLRQGRDYVSLRIPGREKAIRLRGAIYGAGYVAHDLSNMISKPKVSRASEENEIYEKYHKILTSRKKYVASRYKYEETPFKGIEKTCTSDLERIEETSKSSSHALLGPVPNQPNSYNSSTKYPARQLGDRQPGNLTGYKIKTKKVEKNHDRKSHGNLPTKDFGKAGRVPQFNRAE